jgi:hypothetical protein
MLKILATADGIVRLSAPGVSTAPSSIAIFRPSFSAPLREGAECLFGNNTKKSSYRHPLGPAASGPNDDKRWAGMLHARR